MNSTEHNGLFIADDVTEEVETEEDLHRFMQFLVEYPVTHDCPIPRSFGEAGSKNNGVRVERLFSMSIAAHLMGLYLKMMTSKNRPADPYLKAHWLRIGMNEFFDKMYRL